MAETVVKDPKKPVVSAGGSQLGRCWRCTRGEVASMPLTMPRRKDPMRLMTISSQMVEENPSPWGTVVRPPGVRLGLGKTTVTSQRTTAPVTPASPTAKRTAGCSRARTLVPIVFVIGLVVVRAGWG